MGKSILDDYYYQSNIADLQTLLNANVKYDVGYATYDLKDTLNRIFKDIADRDELIEALGEKKFKEYVGITHEDVVNNILEVMVLKMTLDNVEAIMKKDYNENVQKSDNYLNTPGSHGNFIETDIFGIGLGTDTTGAPILAPGRGNRPTEDLDIAEMTRGSHLSESRKIPFNRNGIMNALFNTEIKGRDVMSTSDKQNIGDLTFVGLPAQLGLKYQQPGMRDFMATIAAIIKMEMKMKNWMYFIISRKGHSIRYDSIMLYTILIMKNVMKNLAAGGIIKSAVNKRTKVSGSMVTYSQKYEISITVGSKDKAVGEASQNKIKELYELSFDFLKWVHADVERSKEFYGNVKAHRRSVQYNNSLSN